MTTRARLAIAAVVSAGLHALLISGAWLPAPVPPVDYPPLEARLAPPPQSRTTAVPLPRSESPPREAEPRRTSRTPPPAPSAIAQAPAARPEQPRLETPADTPDASSAGEGSETQPVAAAETGRAPTSAAPNVAAAAETSAPSRPGGFPSKGTITFTLTLGGDGFSVGKAVQTWEVASGSYKLASDAETTGIVGLFRPQRLRWLSKGTITRQGLKPESFLMSRTRRGQTEASEAQFNWSAGSLTYGPARERAAAALPGNTQDIMSFIYQLAIAPPAPGRYRLPITTGSKFETYEIEVRAEEEIETPLGTMRTLPVKQQQRPGAETIEIWLAAQYRYLPVRIRYYDREGRPAGEQVASDIRVSED